MILVLDVNENKNYEKYVNLKKISKSGSRPAIYNPKAIKP